ncbi:phosphoribosyltransferase [Chloroflexota bacterium]
MAVPKAIFENRHDAGRNLATRLGEYAGQSVVVLAIPNGGVPVALEVAAILKADLGLIISRKIPVPLNPERGFGAVADDGTLILNEALAKKIGLSPQQIEREADKVRADIKQRSLLYKGDRPLVRVSGRTVIVIDDGLASGFTMTAAVESVRHRQPKEVVVAVPVASMIALNQLKNIADRVITCATGTTRKFYIADFYRHWHDVSGDEVLRYLTHWRMRHLDEIKPPQGK